MKRALLYTILLVMSSIVYGQGRLIKIDMDAVADGKQLDRATSVSLAKFIEMYVEYSKEIPNKKYGTLQFERIYKDNEYSYFTRNNFNDSYVFRFVKIKNDELAKFDYENVDGQDIRKKFRNEIIPREHKEKSDNCMISYVGGDNDGFTYKFITDSQIELIFKWKIRCAFAITVIDHSYSAIYDFKTKTFSDKKMWRNSRK